VPGPQKRRRASRSARSSRSTGTARSRRRPIFLQEDANNMQTGIVPNTGARYGRGSAAHRFAKCYALRCVRGTKAPAHELVNVCLSPSIQPRLFCSRPVHEGRFMRRLEWGRMRRLGTCLASTEPGGLGFRPALNGVCHCELAGRGQASGAKTPCSRTSTGVCQVPGRTDQVLRRRGGASKGDAVCLYFPAIRETSRGRYPRCAFRRSVSPHLRGERTKSPTRAAARGRERVAV
jgi:hypothetical protein